MLDDLKRIFSRSQGVERLANLIDRLRPEDSSRDPAGNLTELIAALREDRELHRQFCTTVREVLSELRLVHMLVQSGIVSDRGVLSGVGRGIGRFLAPPVAADNDLRTVLPQIFRDSDDWEWVCAIPSEHWAELFELVVDESDALGLPHDDVAAAIRALAQRIGATGIDEEVNAKLTHVEDYDSPFLELSVAAHRFLEDHRVGTGSAETYDAVVATSQACRELVISLRENKHEYGTSMRLTAITRRLLQQLDRFDLMLHLVRPSDPRDFARSLAPLFHNLIEAEQTARSVHRHLGYNIDLLAYQMTEHTAKKGEKYIGRTARDYWNFLLAAMGGGALVAIFAVFKLFLSKLDLPLAAKAVVYGLNYSICFVLIYVTGAILATKQPAITASAIARCIDGSKSRSAALGRVADIIVLVWRSQFVSFVGNLVCAFPIAILIAFLLEYALGIVAADVDKSQALLDANHPWRSGALFYAGIAGVFLFSAGVIQGLVQNRIIYTDLHTRLSHHPGLAWLGRRRQGVVDFFIRHCSGIVSNTALGFMLGSAGTIGVIFGLPIDIRHIAFSSSHFGVATLDAPQLVSMSVIYTVMLGIIGIGFINFLVSFGLTLVVTFKSRQVSFGQSGTLLVILIKRFVTRPQHWFLPLGPYKDSDDEDRDAGLPAEASSAGRPAP
ncbi:MAG: hypothetical protein AAGC55_00550 [Myxococcota bacterium]